MRGEEFGYFSERHLEKVCGFNYSVFIRGQTRLFFFCHDTFFFFSLFALPQVVYFTEMYKIFSELTDQIDQAGLTDEQRERETEAKLSELRALSIVADD